MISARLAFILLALAGAFTFGFKFGADRIQGKWDAEKTALAARHIKAMEQAHDQQVLLDVTIEELRHDRQSEVDRLHRTVANLTDQLRNRPDRPAAGALSAPTSAQPTAIGCDGTQLYRTDAEFLAGEAARADEALSYLKECRAAYKQLTMDSSPTSEKAIR